MIHRLYAIVLLVTCAGVAFAGDVYLGSHGERYLTWGDLTHYGFSPDSSMLISTTNAAVLFHDLETGELLDSSYRFDTEPSYTAIAPNGTQVLALFDDKIVQWKISESGVVTLQEFPGSFGDEFLDFSESAQYVAVFDEIEHFKGDTKIYSTDRFELVSTLADFSERPDQLEILEETNRVFLAFTYHEDVSETGYYTQIDRVQFRSLETGELLAETDDSGIDSDYFCIDLSKDNRFMISFCDYDPTLLWSIETGDVVHTFDNQYQSVKFSNDSSRLFAWRDGILDTIDLNDYSVVQSLETVLAPLVTDFDFYSTASVSENDETLYLVYKDPDSDVLHLIAYDLPTSTLTNDWEIIQSVEGLDYDLTPDESKFVVVEDKWIVKVVDLTGGASRPIEGYSHRMGALAPAFTADGRYFIQRTNSAHTFFDFDSLQKRFRTRSIRKFDVQDALSTDGTLAVLLNRDLFSDDWVYTVSLYDLTSDDLISSATPEPIRAKSAYPKYIQLSQENDLAAVSLGFQEDPAVFIVDLRDGSTAQYFHDGFDFDPETAPIFTPGGASIIAETGAMLTEYSIETKEPIKEFLSVEPTTRYPYTASMHTLTFSPNNTYLIDRYGNGLHVFDYATGEAVYQYDVTESYNTAPTNNYVLNARTSFDERYLMVVQIFDVFIVDLQSGTVVESLPYYLSYPYDGAFHPDMDRVIVVYDDGTRIVWPVRLESSVEGWELF